MDEKNIHKGHRERMLEKAFTSIDSLAEHELLEILLYRILPRVDTNPLAHRLIRVFGSLNGVLSADTKELATVEGVGKRIATEISLLGRIYSRVTAKKEDKPVAFSFSNVKEEIISQLSRLEKEKVIVYFLDNKYKVLHQVPWESSSYDNSSAQVSELVKCVAIYKPKFLIIAHNHPSGNLTPSLEDDYTTKKLNMLCDIHGVSLIDHIIVAKDSAFSYCTSGRLAILKNQSDINKIIKQEI